MAFSRRVSRRGRLAALVLAAGLGLAALGPAPARADDDLVRVIVDVADVIFRGGHPYYRHGDYRHDDRLIVDRDRYGRPLYYRYVSRDYGRYDRRSGPPYGNAYGYWNKRAPQNSRVSCDRNGRCVTRYYDPRYDRRYERRRYDDRYDGYYGYSDRYRRDGRHPYWDGRRWRYDD